MNSKRRINITSYNNGLIGKIKQKKTQKRIAIFTLFFLLFQVLSPFATLIKKTGILAATITTGTWEVSKAPTAMCGAGAEVRLQYRIGGVAQELDYTSIDSTKLTILYSDDTTPAPITVGSIREAGNVGPVDTIYFSPASGTCWNGTSGPSNPYWFTVTEGSTGVKLSNGDLLDTPPSSNEYFEVTSQEYTYVSSVSGSGGTASASSSLGASTAGHLYSGGTVVFTATPDTDYAFSSWGGDCSGSNNPLTITNVGSNKACSATFVSSAAAVTGVTVDPSSATIGIGSTTTLTATVAPTDATNKAVTWRSSNTTAATVSSSGVVTGVSAGISEITVTTADGGKTATSTITVSATNTPVASVSVSPETGDLAVGSTTTLTATVAPTDATNKAVTWTSSNTAAATVSAAGVVTGVGAGTATITATTADGGKTATSIITVTAATDTFQITPNDTTFSDPEKGITVSFSQFPSNVTGGFNISIVTSTATLNGTPMGKEIVRVYSITPVDASGEPIVIPSGVTATITLDYPTGKTYQEGDSVMYWNGSSWINDPNVHVVSHTTNTITFTTTHFSEYSIASTNSDGTTNTSTTSTGTGTLPVTGSNMLNILLNLILAVTCYAGFVGYLKKTKYSKLLA